MITANANLSDDTRYQVYWMQQEVAFLHAPYCFQCGLEYIPYQYNHGQQSWKAQCQCTPTPEEQEAANRLYSAK